jgi:non-canonical (house-cleaning) NTP pyrophosphatase
MTMSNHPKDFWRALQSGIEVAVVSPNPEKLLGVRDGFLTYLRQHLSRVVPVALVPHQVRDRLLGLPLRDEDTVDLARGRARALAEELGDTYQFYVSTEGGLDGVEAGDKTLYFVRSWTAIVGPGGEALGSSSAVQLPERLIEGLENEDLPLAVPGTRRSGGMMSSLTGGVETRRRAVASATFNALSSLFYGQLGWRSGHS